jgi:pimeloyl-ACP methyl ester carboxylesterase
MTKRSHLDDLRAASRLAVEATRGVIGLVEAMHRTIASGPALLGKPLEKPATALTGLVYGHIKNVTDVVGAGIDGALGLLAPLLGESVPGPERELVLAALNGVLGDYLAESKNPLAISFSLRRAGQDLALSKEALLAAIPEASGRILVLVHGSCMNDLQWHRGGHDHGAALERELGFTAIYVRYNSGLHVSTNGRLLAAALEELVSAWPVPVTELCLLGHSMGGLVARSAIHYGGPSLRGLLRRLVCIGTPHHGAPLERGGNWIDVLLGVSRYSAPLAQLGKIRSAGVTDLRFGNVIDEHWAGRDRFEPGPDQRVPVPLPEGVRCFAIAASTTAELGPALAGDGLVPVDSALGRHALGEHDLGFEARWIGLGMDHLALLDRAEVYQTLLGWLR